MQVEFITKIEVIDLGDRVGDIVEVEPGGFDFSPDAGVTICASSLIKIAEKLKQLDAIYNVNGKV